MSGKSPASPRKGKGSATPTPAPAPAPATRRRVAQPKYATSYNPHALMVQKLVGVITSILGVLVLLNPEWVAQHVLIGATADLELFSLISLAGAHQLFVGVLIMTGVCVCN